MDYEPGTVHRCSRLVGFHHIRPGLPGLSIDFVPGSASSTLHVKDQLHWTGCCPCLLSILGRVSGHQRAVAPQRCCSNYRNAQVSLVGKTVFHHNHRGPPTCQQCPLCGTTSIWPPWPPEGSEWEVKGEEAACQAEWHS